MTATSAIAPGDLEWPASPWEASAPESYLLLHFQRRPAAREALKQGILELLARRRLRLVEVRRRGLFGRSSRGSTLVAGTPPGSLALGPALLPLWEVFQAQSARRESVWDAAAPGEMVEGVDVKDFAAAVVKRFGSVDGYVAQAVRPALMERGWVAPERYRILGFFPATRWVLTPAGTAVQGDLLWRVQYGNRELGRLVDDDPSRAIAFAGLAGAAVLLMDDARPHLARLNERLVAGTQTAATGAEGGGYVGSGEGGALDVGDAGAGLDFGSFGLDLGALDAVDAATAAVDFGVDAGSGDGGASGDGGGGDGGGGGGE